MTDLVCARCGAKTTDTTLCRPHQAELQRNLSDLAGTIDLATGRATPGWIENLADACSGQVRMGGDGGRRARTDSESPLRFNDRASDLQRQIHGMLARWVLALTEERGTEYLPVRFVRPDLIGPLRAHELRGVRYSAHGAELALWLGLQLETIMASPDAGNCLDETETAVTAIKTAIDRPTPPRFWGVCPATLDDDQRRRIRARGEPDRKICMTNLWGKPDLVEIQCPTCRRTHNCERVLNELIASMTDKHFTQAELIGYHSGSSRVPGLMDQIGERIPERTFQRWRKDGKLKPRGYRRANGRWGFARRNEDDEPEYLLLDVLRLKDIEELART